MISKDEVKKVAELALLAVDDSELDALTKEMDSIVEYVSEINLLTASVETHTDPVLYNVMREDIATNKPGCYSKRILAEAPSTEENYLIVKKIL